MNYLIPIHIAGGSIALISGAAALFIARKGSPLHARAGTIFFAAMLTLAGTGALIAATTPERGTAVVGLLTCYLVASGWATARRQDGRVTLFEWAGAAFAAVLAATMLGLGVMGLNSPDGRVDSLPAVVHFPFALVAGLAAALDLNFIFKGKLAPRQRIARHVWRMCVGFYIASGSFFLGQQKVMPEAIQGSPWLFVPAFAPLAAMLFWIFRVRFSRAWGRVPPVPRRRAPAVPANSAPARA